MTELVSKVAEYIKKEFQGESSGHDWWHIYRVWQLSKYIAEKEDCNLEIVELGALLHDVADYKFYDGDDEVGGEVATKILKDFGADAGLIESVVHIVDNVSFKGAKNNNGMKSIEGLIVQDADRLDAMGAIGIGRCFAYGGSTGREMYNPDIKPNVGMSKEEYKKNKSPSLNHFYEKLLLLKDMMNTSIGKSIAEVRHKVLEDFLDEFLAEWEGKR